MAFRAQDAKTISWFYAAAFGRTPIPDSTLPGNGDRGGLIFWTHVFIQGGEGDLAQFQGNLDAIGDFFVASPEFQAQFPDSLTNEQFVTALYDNMLGRAADLTGFDFWVNELNTQSRGAVLVDFANTEENQGAVPNQSAALDSFILRIANDDSMPNPVITEEEADVWLAANPNYDAAVIDAVQDTTPPVVDAGQTEKYSEGSAVGATLFTVEAADEEGGSGLASFAIASGNDMDYFAIDASGNISLTEMGAAAGVASNSSTVGDNVFALGVTATDRAGNTSTAVDVVLTVADITPPALQNATSGNNLVILTYSELLDPASSPAPGTFNAQVSGGSFTPSSVQISDRQVVLNFPNLPTGTVTVTYTPPADEAARRLQDLAGNAALAFTDRSAPADRTPPTLVDADVFPPDDETDVPVDITLVLAFNETVRAGTGNITFSNEADPTDNRVIAVTDTSQVTISGTRVTVNPTEDLRNNAAYSVLVDAGAIVDLAGNSFAGISSPDDLDFTTESRPTSLIGGPDDDAIEVPGGLDPTSRIEGGQQRAQGDTLIITAEGAATANVIDLTQFSDQNRTTDVGGRKIGPVVQGFENVDASAATTEMSITGRDRTSEANTGGVDPEQTGSVLIGGAFRDTITGSAGDDYIDGGAANDQIFGISGNNTLKGGAGNDEIWGGSGNDVITDDDRIDLAGNDTIYAGGGNDLITLAGGIDQVFGEGGNDTILYLPGATSGRLPTTGVPGTAPATLDGGAGNDTIDLSNLTAVSFTHVRGGDGNDTIILGEGIEHVDGGTGDDRVVANTETLQYNAATRYPIGPNVVDRLDGDLGSNRLNLDLGVADGNVFTFEPDGFTEIDNFPILALTSSAEIVAPKTYVLKLDNAFLARNGVDTGVGFSDVFLIDARGLPNGSVVQIDTSEIGGAGGYAGQIGVIASVGTNAQTQTGAALGQGTVINGVRYGVDLTSPQTAGIDTPASPAILNNAIGQNVLPEVVPVPVGTYALTANVTAVDEPGTVVFTLTTTEVPEGTEVPATIRGIMGNVNAADFDTPLTQIFTVGADGTATVTVQVRADQTTEGPETFTLALNNSQAESPVISINDTSQDPGAVVVVPLAGETAVTAVDGVAEAFVLNFDSAGGASRSSDAVVTITGFDPAEDILRFNDAADPTISMADFLDVLTGGVNIGADGFNNVTIITFQDDNPNDANPAAQIFLVGIADATLGGAAPFYEVI